MGRTRLQRPACRPLPNLGLDSLLAAELDVRVGQDLGIRTPVLEILRGRTLEQFGEDLYNRLRSARPDLAAAA